MNAPGSPSSPLQMTYFAVAGLLADHPPFRARWESPRRRARATRTSRFDDVSSECCVRGCCDIPRCRRSLCASAERNPSCARYSSRSSGSSLPNCSVAMWTCWSRNALHARVAQAHRRSASPFVLAVVQQQAYPARGPQPRRRAGQAARAEMPLHQAPRLRRRRARRRTRSACPAWRPRSSACDGTCPRSRRVSPPRSRRSRCDALLQRVDTAGRCLWPCSRSPGRRGSRAAAIGRCRRCFRAIVAAARPLLLRQKFADHARAPSPRWRGRTCVSSIRTTGASVQQPRHATCSIVNCRSGSVSSPAGMRKCRRKASSTRSAPVTWQAVPRQTRTMCLPDGLDAEHVVEADATPADRRGRDLAWSAQTRSQRLLRQIAVMVLHRLQDRNDRLGRAPNPRHGLVGKCQVNAGMAHCSLASAPPGARQNRCSTPRRINSSTYERRAGVELFLQVAAAKLLERRGPPRARARRPCFRPRRGGCPTRLGEALTFHVEILLPLLLAVLRVVAGQHARSASR